MKPDVDFKVTGNLRYTKLPRNTFSVGVIIGAFGTVV